METDNFTPAQIQAMFGYLSKLQNQNSATSISSASNIETFKDAVNIFYIRYISSYVGEGGMTNDIMYVKIDRDGKETTLNHKEDIHKLAALFKTLTPVTL